MPAADGHARSTTLTIAYPQHLSRWKPLYKWILAIPHYFVLAALAVASILTAIWGASVAVVTGAHPSGRPISRRPRPRRSRLLPLHGEPGHHRRGKPGGGPEKL